MSLTNNMEGKFSSKILAFVMVITHNCDSFFCWSQIFYILSSICEGFILPSQIRFFERAFWIRHKFLVANRLFFCSVFMGFIALFDIIYESYFTISANFYLYLQYFQQKVFNFSKISGFQTDP